MSCQGIVIFFSVGTFWNAFRDVIFVISVDTFDVIFLNDAVRFFLSLYKLRGKALLPSDCAGDYQEPHLEDDEYFFFFFIFYEATRRTPSQSSAADRHRWSCRLSLELLIQFSDSR